MKPWLTVGEGAEYANVSRDTIYTACERGELRSARISGRHSSLRTKGGRSEEKREREDKPVHVPTLIGY